ncbi:MAG: KID repeat-containing protein [Caudoviricetes sp.]|nr:MAG: KID repeat-containing protein [Caudoviricetes sp.]
MAQQTSALWKTLLRDRNTRREYGFDINGVWYGPEAEVSHSVSSSLFESFGIGNATSATLTLDLYADDIPRGAVIKRYVRLTNDIQTSEWLPKGVFFTNSRALEDGHWTIEAYDAMLKADFTWTPRPGFSFPCTMEAAARDIALSMEVELDERNVYLPYRMNEYPVGEYMRRDALQDIAAAHGGNWYMSDAGKLRLVPLISFPAETNYLVTEYGDAITFGGVRILV